MTEPQPPLGQRCGKDNQERSDMALCRQRQAHVAPAGDNVMPLPKVWRCRDDSSQTLKLGLQVLITESCYKISVHCYF